MNEEHCIAIMASILLAATPYPGKGMVTGRELDDAVFDASRLYDVVHEVMKNRQNEGA